MIFLARLGAGILGGALVGAAALSSEGFVRLRIDEKQPDSTHVNLLVPAALLTTAFRLVPDRDLARGSAELGPYLPLIDRLIPALAESADGVVVEVWDETDHVLVRKRADSLVVDVKGADDAVHVSVPLRAASSAIHRIARAGGGD